MNDYFNIVKLRFKSWKADAYNPEVSIDYLKKFLYVSQESIWNSLNKYSKKRILIDFSRYADSLNDKLFLERNINDKLFSTYLCSLIRFYSCLYKNPIYDFRELLNGYAILSRVSLMMKHEKYSASVFNIIKIVFRETCRSKKFDQRQFVFAILYLNPSDEYLENMFSIGDFDRTNYFDFKMILGSTIIIRAIAEFRKSLESNDNISVLQNRYDKILIAHNNLISLLCIKHVKHEPYGDVSSLYSGNKDKIHNKYVKNKATKLLNLALSGRELSYKLRRDYIEPNTKDIDKNDYTERRLGWEYFSNLNDKLDNLNSFLQEAIEFEVAELRIRKDQLRNHFANLAGIRGISDNDKKKFNRQIRQISSDLSCQKNIELWCKKMKDWNLPNEYLKNDQVSVDVRSSTISYWSKIQDTSEIIGEFLRTQNCKQRSDSIRKKLVQKLEELALDYLTFQVEFIMDNSLSEGLIGIISAQGVLETDNIVFEKVRLTREQKDFIGRIVSGKNKISSYLGKEVIDIHQKISELDSYTNILAENSQILNDSGQEIRNVIRALKVSLKHLRILRKESVQLFPRILVWPILESIEKKIRQMDIIVDKMVKIFETENEAEAKKELESSQITSRMKSNIVEWMKKRFMYEELLDLAISKSTSEDKTTKFLKFIMKGGSLLLIFFPYFLVTIFNIFSGEQSTLPSQNIIHSYLPFIVGILINVCIILYYHISRVKILESVSRNQILTPNILGAIFIAGFQLFVTDEAWGQGFLAHPIIQLVLIIGLVAMSYYLVRNNIIGDQEPIKAEAKNPFKKNTTVVLSKKDDQTKDKSKNMILNRRAWNIVSLGLWQTYVFVALFSMMTSAVMGGESRVNFNVSARHIPQFDYYIGKWAPSTWIYISNVFGKDLDIHILPYAILVWSVEVYFLGAILQTLLQRRNS